MCGIAGFLDHPGDADERRADLHRMAGALAHRGPDHFGEWHRAELGLGLGHRRLAVLDPSPLGNQPMWSPSRRYALVHNGEVYNFRALAAEITAKTGTAPRSRSDTEVMLAAVEAWGLERALERFVGMFAFALWDDAARELHLVRDRFGIKPLHYARAGGALLFASEPAGLRASRLFDTALDPRAIIAYFRLGYVPAPDCIYGAARKLPPGSRLVVRPGGEPEVVRWYRPPEASAGSAVPPPDLEDALHDLARTAVADRLVSDVPLGVLLSGGIDSSLVAALAAAASPEPVRTFTVGSEDVAFDESAPARAVAAHLGTRHTELRVSAADVVSAVADMPRVFSEPFADPSMVPTQVVSRLARQQVTVALSGDGGDEVFGGYNRYVHGARAWRWSRRVPAFARATAGRLLDSPGLGRVADVLSTVASPGVPGPRRSQGLAKAARAFRAPSQGEFYRSLVSYWESPGDLLTLPTPEPPPPSLSGDPVASMMDADLAGYLPDDILTKVDRASMSVALEARVPLLDHRLVAWARGVPASCHVRGGAGKQLLRGVLARYVPRALFARPKTGFLIPLGRELRGPLREWAEDLLAPAALRAQGILDPAVVQGAWRDHLAGSDREREVWSVLMFQAWLQAHRELPRVPVTGAPHTAPRTR